MCIRDSAYTFSDVRSDHAIRAVFRPAGSVPVEPSYAVVHALADEGGTISPAGDVRVEKGGSVSFVMLPYDGYRLADVTLDGNSVMGRVQEGLSLIHICGSIPRLMRRGAQVDSRSRLSMSSL